MPKDSDFSEEEFSVNKPKPEVYGPFLKKDYFRKVVTEKYTRHTLATKIGNFYKEKGKIVGKDRGIIIYVYEHKHKLIFVRFSYSGVYSPNANFGSSKSVFGIYCKNGKVNTFAIHDDKPKNRNLRIYNELSRIFVLRKQLPAKKSAFTRLSPILRRFAKNNNLKLKKNFRIERDLDLAFQFQEWVYPLLGTFNLSNLSKIPHGASRFLKEKQLKVALKRSFGSSGKVITRIILDNAKMGDFNPFVTGYLCKGLVPIDKLQDYLINARTTENNYRLPQLKLFKEFIRALPPAKRVQFLNETGFRGWRFKDTVEQWNYPSSNDGRGRIHNERLPFPEKIRTCEELHDYFSELISNIKNPTIKFTYKEKYMAVDNAVVDDMTIVLPKDSKELKNWGKQMHNCVGGYDNKIESETSLILGVLKNNDLTYNIEIRFGNIHQFFAACNKPADENDKDKIIAFLEENKIITTKTVRMADLNHYQNPNDEDEPIPNEELALNA